MKSSALSLVAIAAIVAGVPMEPHGEAKVEQAGGQPRVEEAEWRSSFHIKKAVDSVHEVKLGSHVCQFTYRAANTAHEEAWQMELTREGDEFTCEIRDVDPTPPHATFYGFSAHMFEAKQDVITFDEVWDHAGQLMLSGEDYIVEGNSIRTTSHWDMRGVAVITIKSE
mmetsp:Transcript_39447/g.79073  ORF Transcript_39447/g.79073 Transcript_39447/m.79073 type:complete len:168 (+) Transcript_39447:26-529(+)